jgi:hypothetical protein
MTYVFELDIAKFASFCYGVVGNFGAARTAAHSASYNVMLNPTHWRV